MVAGIARRGAWIVAAAAAAWLVVGSVVGSMGGTANAADISDEEAVRAAADSLGGRADFPWYDSARDEIRRVDVEPIYEGDAANRGSSWESNFGPPKQRTGTPINFNPSLIWNVIRFFFWGLVAALLAGLVALVIWAFLKAEGRGASSSVAGESDGTRDASDVDRVENLPFQVKRPNADLLAEARRHYEEGNYGEAVIYLFSYMLVQLDKNQQIHLTKGKTNRQYLYELGRRSTLFPILERTMIAFEDVFFGDHSLDKERFEQCWNSLDQFHNEVEQPA